ncbi:hypothetical protein HID58_046876 [Brassica napus]|uniref:Uncharacterized protein n=1 Tax=Brassica napus TaxID=3708 RepID=A0ABQ8AYQ5_BRANA|nr:hypothetical protein HID58_046876 [Brassica napus]
METLGEFLAALPALVHRRLLPPDLPPDPPDPTSPLSPQDYPPLTNSPAAPKFKYPTVQRSVRGARYPSQTVAAAKSVDITMTPQEEMVGAATQIETGPISGPETDPQTGSEPTVSFSFPVNTVEAGSCSKSPFTTQRFTTLPPNQPSPILTNKVSSNDQQTTSQNTVPQNPTQTAYALIPASPPHPRPSLKRSRSSPTFSPTSTPNTNPNPFLPLCSDPIKALPFSAMSKTPPPQISLPLSNPPGPILRFGLLQVWAFVL